MRIRSSSDLGATLRHARQEAGMTQGDLALWLGVSRYYIGTLESGAGTERLERLIAALGLLGWDLYAARRGELPSRPLDDPPELGR